MRELVSSYEKNTVSSEKKFTGLHTLYFKRNEEKHHSTKYLLLLPFIVKAMETLKAGGDGDDRG